MKHNAYQEGEDKLTPESLMETTSNKYNALVNAGTWAEASPRRFQRKQKRRPRKAKVGHACESR